MVLFVLSVVPFTQPFAALDPSDFHGRTTAGPEVSAAQTTPAQPAETDAIVRVRGITRSDAIVDTASVTPIRCSTVRGTLDRTVTARAAVNRSHNSVLRL
jgi:hypothetical protein